MNYRFTAILIVMLCILTICAKPIQNPSLKKETKNTILPKPKPKCNE
tara:strand:- start:1508 stop:1648 length:141 start_codon:yes stop_codon:yes gene_type:complete